MKNTIHSYSNNNNFIFFVFNAQCRLQPSPVSAALRDCGRCGKCGRRRRHVTAAFVLQKHVDFLEGWSQFGISGPAFHHEIINLLGAVLDRLLEAFEFVAVRLTESKDVLDDLGVA